MAAYLGSIEPFIKDGVVDKLTSSWATKSLGFFKIKSFKFFISSIDLPSNAARQRYLAFVQFRHAAVAKRAEAQQQASQKHRRAAASFHTRREKYTVFAQLPRL